MTTKCFECDKPGILPLRVNRTIRAYCTEHYCRIRAKREARKMLKEKAE